LDLSVCRISNYNIDVKVVLVDRFGLLEYLYSIADKIFVGGSLTDVGGIISLRRFSLKKLLQLEAICQILKRSLSLQKI